LGIGISVAFRDGAWPFRFLIGDSARDLVRAATLEAVRALTGQKFVEQNAQRINIG
jgi:hypothetical protein